jgi:predicted dehydrogenase/threonine dehydrogenase-like Zn-dependent dehydrogenase
MAAMVDQIAVAETRLIHVDIGYQVKRMKQLLQNLKNGATEIADVPCPVVGKGQILICTARTLVSAGTERMLVEFGKAGWIEKARQQPDKVAMVLNKIRTDGLIPTVEAVFNKLGQPLPLGYCNVGTVARLGTGVIGFSEGDRVASNGKHADMVSVPANLCAKIPEQVSDDEAAFTVVGAVALQGIRLVGPTLGETVVVTGLGLIGLLTVQLLRAHGCRVLGLDFDPAKLAIARQLGAEVVDLASGQDPLAAAELFSRGRGVDAVIVTAATKSSEPMHQAALMCRKRGRIVLVGVTGLELSRDDFFKKELTFQVSASYGPGRYDSNYEDKGQDYPVGFVRWTAQRNFEAVLDMMADGRLNVKPLISHRFPIADAVGAYELIGGAAPSLGIVLEYGSPHISVAEQTVRLQPAVDNSSRYASNAAPAVSFIGSGNYATAVLIPAFKAAGARLRSVASNNGVSGVHAGRRFGFEETTTATDSLFIDPNVDALVITTRHDSHAELVCKALAAGKHVYVEKPLALTLNDINSIERSFNAARERGHEKVLMVGFNRRFAPHVQKIKSLLDSVREPKSFIMTVNAGAIPADHWTQDVNVGGGRIVGEACHFIDLLRYLSAAIISKASITKMNSPTADTASVSLVFADGSHGVIHYLANGSKAYPKERLEVFAAGRVLQLDNFRRLKGFGWPGFNAMNLWRQDKGQKACAQKFIDAVCMGGPAPIPVSEILEVARITIELGEAARC